jgi:hypothetical protein
LRKKYTNPEKVKNQKVLENIVGLNKQAQMCAEGCEGVFL